MKAKIKNLEKLKTAATVQKTGKVLAEFKEFIARGNVLDLAIGMIVGAAFTKIVSSLVNDILTPVLGIILNGIDFSDLSLDVGAAKITYGVFIENVIDFVIVAACIFVIVKVINKFMRQEKQKQDETPKKPTTDELILKELRTLNKNLSTK